MLLRWPPVLPEARDTVERIPQDSSISQSVKRVRFSLDDAESLLAKLKSVGPIFLEDKDFRYASLEELKSHRGEVPGAFTIRTSPPGYFEQIRVTYEHEFLGEYRWHVEYRGDDPARQVVARDVVRMLEARRLWWTRPMGTGLGWWLLIATVAATAPTGVDALGYKVPPRLPWVLDAIQLALLLLWAGLAPLRCRVVLRRPHEGGFWKRRGGDIAVNIISGAAGVVLGWMLGRVGVK